MIIRSGRARAFTLIEVLVALAIVTVGMAALLGALSSSADSASYQRDKTFAEWVALNRLEEVRLALQRPTKGKTEGEAELAGRKWKWAQEVLETEVKGIMRVEVSVRPLDSPGTADSGWFTTVSAITGDALALPRGDMDPYAVAPAAGAPGGPGAPGSPRNGQSGDDEPTPAPPSAPPDNGVSPNPTD
jgi:general secretion pathway protein I